MKLLVCISKTPETTARIAFNDDRTKFAEDGVNFIMNPYDEWYALVKAIELKEQHGGSVTVINVGPASNDIVIRKALAIGADDAIRINIEPTDAYTVARSIGDHIADSGYDMIFLGKETIDYNGSEVGGMLAEILQMPFISNASDLSIDGSTASVTRDVAGGTEVVQLDTPCVVGAAKGLAEQRIPNMRGIMMAKRKPLEVVTPGVVDARNTAVGFDLPAGKSAVTLVDPDNMDELVRLLHEEARVI